MMTLLDFERHLIGQLCWACHAATRPSHERQRRCPACRRKWSYERRRVRWELTKAFALKGSVFYTDEFTSYNDVARYGKHVPVNHQETFGVGVAHINGIEGFWSFAKRLHRQVHGVDRDHFPLYLAEYEFRYNHRNDHLPTILFEALIHPQLREDGLA